MECGKYGNAVVTDLRMFDNIKSKIRLVCMIKHSTQYEMGRGSAHKYSAEWQKQVEQLQAVRASPLLRWFKRGLLVIGKGLPWPSPCWL